MKAFVFTIDALLALFVATALLSLSFAAQKQLSTDHHSRFSSDLTRSFEILGGINATAIRSLYATESKCGFLLVRDASLSPLQAVFACECNADEDVATASLVNASGASLQELLIEVHSCPA